MATSDLVNSFDQLHLNPPPEPTTRPHLPSSPSSSPSKPPTIPHLPPELIAHIIELSLPELNSKTFPERYATLLPYHLVNKTWCSLARTLLFQHVRVETPQVVNRLRKVLTYSGMGRWLEETRTLWSGEHSLIEGSQATPHFLLRDCIKLEEFLAMYNIITPESTEFMSTIHRLVLYFSPFGAYGKEWEGHKPSPLSHVTTLLLLGPQFHRSFGEDWTSFLNPTILPALRVLSFDAQDDDDVVDDSWLDPSWNLAIASLAPQLRSLSVYNNRMDFRRLDWQLFTTLQHLFIETDFCHLVKIVQELCDLPTSSLTMLRLSVGDDWCFYDEASDRFESEFYVLSNEVAQSVLNGSLAFSSLKVILLEGESEDQLTRDGYKSWRTLQAVMKERGVRLTWWDKYKKWMPAEWGGLHQFWE